MCRPLKLLLCGGGVENSRG